MNKIHVFLIVVSALLISLAQPIKAQEGTWSGKLEVAGNSLRLVFHLNGDNCTMDSPDQGAKDIPMKRNAVPSPKVSLSVPAIGAEFNGERVGQQIVGTFIQQGYKFPLTLEQGVEVRKRPQTPKGPFPYTSEEVSFSNDKAVLKGTLTLPKNVQKETPVFIMVTGSGLQNRDEELFEHKPFAVLADAFARNGIATLRYDDRGFGQSTGDLKEVTTDDLKKDAQAGISFLRKRFKRVGVLGHSEGGTIALMLAAEGQVDWAISLAGMAVSGKSLLMDQNRDMLSLAGYSKEVVDSYLRCLDELFGQIIAGKKLQVTHADRLPMELKSNLQQVIKTSDTPYMRRFLQLDVADLLGRIHCPVLALNGTKDSQVNCQKNLSVLKKGIKSPNSSIQSCKGLNHLFQSCRTGAVSEYKDIEETFSTKVIDIMIQWIHKNQSL